MPQRREKKKREKKHENWWGPIEPKEGGLLGKMTLWKKKRSGVIKED